ncbi:MAG TPA: hypothetical protein VF533_11055 [Solirubrobacteraceae bacterium]
MAAPDHHERDGEARRTSASLAAALERDRLAFRVGRVEHALLALRRRADEHRREIGAPPAHLHHAIADFEAEAQAMRARLEALDAQEPTFERAAAGRPDGDARPRR